MDSVHFAGEPITYEIEGIDYKYLNYPAFKRNIKKGDAVTIGVKGNNILTFQKMELSISNLTKPNCTKSKIAFLHGLYIIQD